MERVASLLPSATEIACALGFEAQLVGRSHECDFPASVAALPVLTEARLDPRAPGREIDARVKRLVRDGLSVYRVDAERLRALGPELILTQDQCRVCAASPADLEQALADWIGGRPRVLSLDPRTLADVGRDFLRVAEALGAPDAGRRLAAAFSARLAEVGERSLRLGERPRLACIEWIEPLMAAGHWMPELVRAAGGTPLLAETGRPSPWIGWEELRRADPDAIAVLPCGFDLARTRRELAPLLAQPGWPELRAVRTGRVYLADGHHYMNRPGPRLADSAEILAEMLHPEAFAPRHAGRAWEPLA